MPYDSELRRLFTEYACAIAAIGRQWVVLIVKPVNQMINTAVAKLNAHGVVLEKGLVVGW